ncbi:hypothetical protein GCM10022224_103820 [Nonomuraea antimicrobica]|uniref:Chromosome partition protein Smc n=1 Tax=Nonomuraea antimicrobica TaxID=561173 RepID=A0ABP7EMI5_9ACTN
MKLIERATHSAPVICAFPGCELLAVMVTAGRPGARPKYCDLVDDNDRRLHTALTAFRERERIARAEGKGRGRPADSERPVSASITRAIEVHERIRADIAQLTKRLEGLVAEFDRIGDVEAVEAEVEAARAHADRQIAAMREQLAGEVQRRRQAEEEAEEAQRAAAEAVEQLREAEEAACRATEQATEARQALDRGLALAERQIAAVQAEAATAVEATERRATEQERQAAAAVTEAETRAALAAQAEAEARAQARQARKDAERERQVLQESYEARLAALEESRAELRARAERAEELAQNERTERRRLTDDGHHRARVRKTRQDANGVSHVVNGTAP